MDKNFAYLKNVALGVFIIGNALKHLRKLYIILKHIYIYRFTSVN